MVLITGLVFPFGNGAERILQNKNPGASIHGLDLNRHSKKHIDRAVQEGIVFSLIYGLEIMQGMGVNHKVIRVGKANMSFEQCIKSKKSDTLEEIYYNWKKVLDSAELEIEGVD